MTDRYTKIVLTIIAVCLVWIAARDTAVPTYAQGTMNVNIEQVAGKIIRCGIGCASIGVDGIPVHID
jgi:hypothetical protein